MLVEDNPTHGTGIMRLTKWPLPLIAALALATGAVLAGAVRTARISADDALIMNLAGRQRMLTQAFAGKHLAAVLGGGDPSTRTELDAVARQFEDGLHALTDGGSVMYGDSAVSLPPTRDPAFRAALEGVWERWAELRSASTGLLDGVPGDPSFEQLLAGFGQASVEAVESMDRAVRMYGQVAKARATRSVRLQSALVLLGAVALTLGLLGTRRTQLLTEAKRLQAAALDAAENVIVITDREGIIKWANPAYVRLTGYTLAEVSSGTPRILKSGKHDPAFYKELWDTILAGRIWHGEVINKRKDGTLYPEDQIITPVFDDGGKITHFIAVKQDISQRKRYEDELKAANKDLEAFAYSVSHDLRGPLRAIDGFSRILLEECTDQLDAEGQRLLQVVCDNTNLMGQLIDDILELSRIGRSAIEPARIDMREAVAAAVQQAQQQHADDELPIKVHDLPAAVGDERLIRQVWTNLLTNAVKFTANRESPVIEVRGVAENNEHVYSVTDNGAGFDMQHAGKLFSLFQRLHSREEFDGTGVGLAIVKRIVERHGGRVWAEGKVNEGASFFFALPNTGI